MRWKPTLLMLGGAAALLNAAYLPLLGPAPLRFREEIPGPPFVLPPLKMEEDPPADTAAQDTTPTTTEEATPPADTTPTATDTSPAPPAIPPTNNVAAQTPVVSGSEDPAAVAPQVLLQFFRPNSNGVSVMAPLNFTPPGSQRPSSSATYQSR